MTTQNCPTCIDYQRRTNELERNRAPMAERVALALEWLKHQQTVHFLRVAVAKAVKR